MMFNNQLYLRSDYYDNAKHQHTIVFFAVQPDGSLSQPIPIYAWEGKEKDELCQIYTSKNYQYLLIVKKLPVRKKDNVVQLEWTVLDKNLNIDWTKKMEFALDDEASNKNATRYSYLANTVIDNEGRVFILNLMKEREKMKIVHHLELNQFSKTGKTIVYPLDLEDKSLGQFTLLETDRPNEFICTGTFTRKHSVIEFNGVDDAQGTFFFRLNTNAGTVEQHSMSPFSNKLYGDNEHIKDNKDLNIAGLKIIDAYLTPNGNTVLLLDKQREINITSYSGRSNTPSTKTYYCSEHLFSIKYSETGQCIAQNMVMRSIMNGNPKDGLGFLVGRKVEQHAIFYNDARKNSEKSRRYHTTYPGSRRCVLRMAVFNGKEKVKISDVLEPKNHKVIFNPAYSVRNTDGSLTTLLLGHKQVQLLKLKF
jgi:hypothetical protein